ncbi:cullin-associated NEDD8-dissociated protein 1-like [Ornithorhynchus anatinus]|uniref:TATA-binding protein interacting (TIP20) domain-containing protein n=1 Tax=Ornithorhynchus anatinus TaxID=9258 RepID=F7G977_ORNAN|nr:cullin-associated NEDD8-dissociated protein 1-like [Ornithorhynchus anatinus]
MNTPSFLIQSLLEKMESADKDLRFMATYDLIMMLKKDYVIMDENTTRKVAMMVPMLTQDQNASVQTLAVTCLCLLVQKVKETQVEVIVDTLCVSMLTGSNKFRDMSGISLGKVIKEFSSLTVSPVIIQVFQRLTTQLVDAIERHHDVSVQIEALDILPQVLSRLGKALLDVQIPVLHCLISVLTTPNSTLRKRAINALGCLVSSCNGDILSLLMDHLLTGIRSHRSFSTIKTYIQCVTTIGKMACCHIEKYLEQIILLLGQVCSMEDEDLRENCFYAYEVFTRRYSRELDPFIPSITKMCLQYLAYDPIYGNNSEGATDDQPDSSDEAAEQESDDQFSDDDDDDDMSWKVRGAVAKCLDAVICTWPNQLLEFYHTLSPALIDRFREREENVLAKIFDAYISLLKQTQYTKDRLQIVMAKDRESTPLLMLQDQVPHIVNALYQLLMSKNNKVRQGCVTLLIELCNTLPGSLTEHVPVLVPGIAFSLANKLHPSMRFDTLFFFHTLLTTHPCEAFQPHIAALLPSVMVCLGDPLNKISSEALLVTQQLVMVLRPLGGASHFDARPHVRQIFTAILDKLKATHPDQKVQEQALICMGQVVCHFGDHLGDELEPTLLILVEKLKHEISPLTTVKAVTLVADCSLKVDLGPLVGEALPILVPFLQTNEWSLKTATLTALKTLMRRHSAGLTPAAVEVVLAQLPVLISDRDMHISEVIVSFLTTVAQCHLDSLTKVSDSLLPKILELIYSPLLHTGALPTITDFFRAWVGPGSYVELMSQLIDPIYDSSASALELPKQTYNSVATCVAALTSSCPREVPGTVRRFVQDAQSPSSSPAVKVLAFFVLAELRQDVRREEHPELKDVLLGALSSPSQEVKEAASYALGFVGAANLSDYLPRLLKEIIIPSRRQYLLLQSLKELIGTAPAKTLRPYVEAIWALLFIHCKDAADWGQSVVAKCLAQLVLVDPGQLLPRLRVKLLSDSPNIRGTVVTSVKFLIFKSVQPIDDLLEDCIGDFLETLQDSDFNVCQVALALFIILAHNKPSLIRDRLDTLLPHVYIKTKVCRALIREVEMGPFKHRVDDGLDLRKTAFECLYTLLDSCLDKLNIYEYLEHVEEGLNDHYDIKMLIFILLNRLSKLCPLDLLPKIEGLLEPLRIICTSEIPSSPIWHHLTSSPVQIFPPRG